MKLLLVGLVAGLVLGFAVGWFLSPGPYRHFYKTTKEFEVLGGEGTVIGRLPAGSPMLSDQRLVRAPDWGWWAYVPIQFDTMWSAMDLGIVSGERLNSVTNIKLRANSFPGEAPVTAEDPSPE